MEIGYELFLKSRRLNVREDRLLNSEVEKLSDLSGTLRVKRGNPGAENAEMSELVQHLIREKEVLKGQLAIAKSDSATLEKKLKSAERQLVLVQSRWLALLVLSTKERYPSCVTHGRHASREFCLHDTQAALWTAPVRDRWICCCTCCVEYVAPANISTDIWQKVAG